MEHQISDFLELLYPDPNIIIEAVNTDHIIYQSRTGTNRKVRVPLSLTSNLAYFIGMMLGDGYLAKERFRFGIEKGNKEYLDNIVAPLISGLFNLDLEVKEVRRWWRVSVRSKGIWLLLTEVFGFEPGKRKKIAVPEPIHKSNANIKLHFLAGILDTDGGKRGKGFGFSTFSESFNNEIITLLNKFGLYPFRDSWLNKQYLKYYFGWKIESKLQLEKFSKTIPLKNSKRVNNLAKTMQGCRSGQTG